MAWLNWKPLTRASSTQLCSSNIYIYIYYIHVQFVGFCAEISRTFISLGSKHLSTHEKSRGHCVTANVSAIRSSVPVLGCSQAEDSIVFYIRDCSCSKDFRPKETIRNLWTSQKFSKAFCTCHLFFSVTFPNSQKRPKMAQASQAAFPGWCSGVFVCSPSQSGRPRSGELAPSDRWGTPPEPGLLCLAHATRRDVRK